MKFVLTIDLGSDKRALPVAEAISAHMLQVAAWFQGFDLDDEAASGFDPTIYDVGTSNKIGSWRLTTEKEIPA